MNLLVADDEFLIRNGIVSLDWGRIGITRVLMAFNGLEAKELIDELLTLENPYHCPHGRPTIISMSKYEIEKKFKRIVT